MQTLRKKWYMALTRYSLLLRNVRTSSKSPSYFKSGSSRRVFSEVTEQPRIADSHTETVWGEDPIEVVTMVCYF